MPRTPALWLDELCGDLRYAFRTSIRSPGFSTVVVATLALGIGANTAIFSVINALMLRSLPVYAPEQLVEPLFKYPKDPRLNDYRWRHYELFRDQNHVFSNLIAVSTDRFQVNRRSSGAEVVDGMYVSANFFEALGVQPAIGRVISPSESTSSANTAAVAIISWSYWQSRFNLDPAALDTPLVVNNVPVTIVGVMRREFTGLQLGMDPALWMPVAIEPLFQKPSRVADGSLNVSLIGRLKPGVTREQAQAEMRVLDRARLADLEARMHDVQWRGVRIELEPAGAGLSVLRDRFSTSLLLTMVVVGLLLLVACINVASMLLSRGLARRREMSVRVALGAGRFRIVRQMLTESLMLSLCAGACSLVVAYWGVRALVAVIASGRSPVGMPQPLQIPVHLDLHVLLFAAGASAVTGLLFGLVPAWHAFVATPSLSLRETGGAGEPTPWKRLNQSLVVAQVALSVVLLTGAALFGGYLTNLRTVGLGFETNSVLQVRLDWSHSSYKPAQIGLLNRQLLDRLRSLAGVRSATLAAMTPLSGAAGSQFITVNGFTESPDARRRVSLNLVAPGYFDTLGTPLFAGRDFGAADEGGQRAAIVNQAMAQYYFGERSPLGHQFTIEGQATPLEIVGVAGNAKYWDAHEAPPRTIYMNAFQGGGPNLLFVLRTSVPPMSVAGNVRRTVADFLPTVPVARITTLAEQVDASILPERLIAMLSRLFAVLAAILVAIGLYGALAYSVTRRTKEIGVRIAIGASRRDVIQMVLTTAFGLVSTGIILGIPIAFWAKSYAARVLAIVAAAQLEGALTLPATPSTDVVIAVVAMLVVTLIASYVPARRATRVDPIVALRSE
jgi:predicted permease